MCNVSGVTQVLKPFKGQMSSIHESFCVKDGAYGSSGVFISHDDDDNMGGGL